MSREGLRGWKDVLGTRTYYLYDGGNPVVELDASGSVTAVNVHAPDGLVARIVGTTATQYAFDPQGNVGQRLDASGSVLSSSVYDGYGQKSSTSTPIDPFGHDGRWGYYQDRETGLALCGHRYYDPSNGRWLSRDPIGVYGGVNVYSYCGGSPTEYADPSGLDQVPTLNLGTPPLTYRDPGDDPLAPPAWTEPGRGWPGHPGSGPGGFSSPSKPGGGSLFPPGTVTPAAPSAAESALR